MPDDFEIREPSSEAEFELYRELRWRVLRRPLGLPQPEGPYEPGTIHLVAWRDGRAIGAARMNFNSAEEAEIRGVAVEECNSRQGIGGAIIAELERRAKELGAARIVLNARDGAVGFYEKQGYQVVSEFPPEFHPVRHFRMMKEL